VERLAGGDETRQDCRGPAAVVASNGLLPVAGLLLVVLFPVHRTRPVSDNTHARRACGHLPGLSLGAISRGRWVPRTDTAGIQEGKPILACGFSAAAVLGTSADVGDISLATPVPGPPN